MSNSYVWRTLSSATTPGQSGSGSDGNEGVFPIPPNSRITGASPSDCLMLYPGYSLAGRFLLPCRGSGLQDPSEYSSQSYQCCGSYVLDSSSGLHFLQPQPTWLLRSEKIWSYSDFSETLPLKTSVKNRHRVKIIMNYDVKIITFNLIDTDQMCYIWSEFIWFGLLGFMAYQPLEVI